MNVILLKTCIFFLKHAIDQNKISNVALFHIVRIIKIIFIYKKNRGPIGVSS